MTQKIEQSAFAEFVAALWEKQGWQTQVTTKSGKSFVVLHRAGSEGLIWARAATGDGVSGKALQQFVTVCKQYEVEEGAVVTQGTFTDDAEKIASQFGVQLVDGEKLKTIIEARELHDLVHQFADEGGDNENDQAADESTDEDNGFFLPIPAAVPPKAAAGVVVAVLAIVLAVVVPTILGTGGTVEEAGWNVTAASTTPDNATAALDVQWNAKWVDELDPKSGDEGVYRPREGEPFLLVSMNVTNAGSDPVGLKPQQFALRSNGTLSGHQPLVNASGFTPTVLEAGESVTVWTVFSIDNDATEATIEVSERANGSGLRVRFVRDTELSPAL
ncbi:restriction endonuclease [Haladaptatus sp. NG-WS-4]